MTIVLDRIVLRVPRIEDALAMHEGWAADADVTRYLVWSPHTSLSETEAYLRFALSCWDEGTERTWMICLKLTLAPVGTITLTKFGFKAGMGFALSRAYWRRGLVLEAAKAVLEIGFSDPAIHRIGGYCDVENVASARLMEKVGMSLEGCLRNWLVHPSRSASPRDCLSYAAIRGA